MRVIVHADDCGLSAGITDAILRCHDAGLLQRTSVVANGAAWDYAVRLLQQRPRLAVALHLNLFEGRPLSPPEEVNLLVDRHGRFTRGFVGLWAKCVTHARIRNQLRLELRRQVERFVTAFGDRGALTVDGHVHYHVIPPVFDCLLELCAEYPIAAVRLPREPLYWPPMLAGGRPRLANVAKNLVLRALSHRAVRALPATSLATTDAFIGVLGTGNMTLAHIAAALEHLRVRSTARTVEILFHPGRARAHEADLWSDRPRLRTLYLSPDRDREAELLCSPALAQLLQLYGGTPGGHRMPSSPSELLQ